jgi:hypothetical protein
MPEDLRPTFLGRLSIILLTIVFGVPVACILIIGTWGTILVPLVVAIYAAPLFLLNYVVWGHALSQKLREHEDADGPEG